MLIEMQSPEIEKIIAARDEQIHDLAVRLTELETRLQDEGRGLKGYESITGLSKVLGVSTKTIRAQVKEMESFVGPGKRYPTKVLIKPGNGSATKVSTDAYADYCRNRKRLADKNMAKYVEPYLECY